MNALRAFSRPVIALVLLVPAIVDAQSANFRAQAKYYSAKSAFEGGRFAEAITLIGESKTLLGGSNDLVQYLHVMSAYRAGRYREAQREMTRFFDIIERRETAVRFSRGVDELTDDEVRAVTMLLDHIDREVANNTEGRRADDANRAAVIAEYRSAWRAFVATIATERQAADGLGEDYTSLVGRTVLSGEPESATLEFTERQDIRDDAFPSWRAGIRYRAVGTIDFTRVTRARAATFAAWPLKADVSFSSRNRLDDGHPVIALTLPAAVNFATSDEFWRWGGGAVRDASRYEKVTSQTDSYSSAIVYIPVRDAAAAVAAMERFRTALAAYRGAGAR